MALFNMMIRDKDIGLLRIDKDRYEIINYDERIERVFKNVDALVNKKIRRAIRSSIDRMIADVKDLTLETYAYWTHCISVTDNIWLKMCGEDVRWADVNPHRAEVDPEISRAAEYGLKMSSVKLGVEDPMGIEAMSASVNMQLGGTSDKCVLTSGRGIETLFKTRGDTNNLRENVRLYSEGIATDVAKQFGAHNFVKYAVFENKLDNGNIRVISGCNMYTNEVKNSLALCDSSLHSYKMKQLMSMCDGAYVDQIADMMIIDSIVVNKGRSYDNIEILYDNSFKIIGIAPVFDFDDCLGWKADLDEDSISDACESECTSVNKLHGMTFNEQAVQFAGNDTRDKLNSIDVDAIDIDRYAGLTPQRKALIREIIKRRIHDVSNAISSSRI